jgi:adenine phosphoribosyltransferase
VSIAKYIRTISDYPKPGIQFRDITTLLNDAEGLRVCIDQIADRYREQRVDHVVGIEARGFIFGTAVAYTLGVGFVPLRKPGKLPGPTVGVNYQLEYGEDRIEMHNDAIREGDRIILMDDLIATGGTAAAAIELIEGAGGNIIECCFVVDLPDLGGAQRLQQLGHSPFSLCQFEGD